MSIDFSDAVQPSHSLLPNSPVLNLSKHPSIFQRVGSLQEVDIGDTWGSG